MLKKLHVLLLTAFLLCWANVAFAGTIVVHDSTGWVPSGDISALRNESGNWPFEVHLLVENASSFQALEDHAHTAVDGTNVMVIAIDPAHHKTVTRFGTSTGVKSGDYDSISQAGNAHFRSHEIRQGIEAIIQRAKASKEATTAISSSNTPVVLKQGLGVGTWLCIILGFVALCGFIVWLVRRQKKDRDSFEKALNDNRDETSELRSRNIREMAYEDALEDASKKKTARAQASSDDDDVDPQPRRRRRSAAPAPVYTPPPAPVYSAPMYSAPVAVSQPGPVVINNSSNNSSGDLLTGVLIGESLSRPRRDEVIVEREIIHDRGGYSSSYSSNDSGGSSSSWDSGSSSSWSDSSSSSDDSGGSSSSWDSGSSSSFDTGSSDSSSSSFDSGGSSDSGGGDSSW